jgi:hypothetical protein
MDTKPALPRNVLVAEANTVVAKHFSNLIRQAYGDQFKPMVAEVLDSDTKAMKFSREKLLTLLRKQEFSAIFLNGGPGLGGGVRTDDKKVPDGRRILKRLREGGFV